MQIAVSIGKHEDKEWWAIVFADDGLNKIERMEGPFRSESDIRARLAELGMDKMEIESRIQPARHHT